MHTDNALSTPISSLPNTRSVTIAKLKSLGITTYADLIHYLPRKYDDRSVIAPISTLQEGEKVSIIGTVTSFKNLYARRGFTIQSAVIEDETGSITATWFNQRFLSSILKVGVLVALWGEIKQSQSKKVIFPAEYELKRSDQELVHMGKLVPVYPETRGLSTKTIREKILHALQVLRELPKEEIEIYPADFLKEFRLTPEKEALEVIHNPQSIKAVEQAKSRLAFDELFFIQLAVAITRKKWEQEKVTHGLEIAPFQKKLDQWIARLPFTLTQGQEKVIGEILSDLSQTKPMNRFLQGDVGSGKTVVAAVAAYLTFLNGYKTLVMAPTEILAQQHYDTFTQINNKSDIHIGLITSSTKPAEVKKVVQVCEIIVGTHALLHKTFESEKIGLVVIDEQHRFGVKQRAELKKRGINPHLLTMTATPIPRTMALTIYGELDMSIIHEMPKDRLPIKSWVVPTVKRNPAYNWIAKQIDKGDQVFVICPLIEESEVESMKSTRAAVKEFEHLSQKVFSKYRLGLIHGRMKSKEKDDVMKKFKDKEFQILVSTSVVEVGIDIPNATIIVIEGAERFGLAQLHQLRGRVGRGSKQSYCLLFMSDAKEGENQRLTFFSHHLSGLELAEYDLRVRGSGEIYGAKQHGISDLTIANITDLNLIERTKKAVEYFLLNYRLDNTPKVQNRLRTFAPETIARD